MVDIEKMLNDPYTLPDVNYKKSVWWLITEEQRDAIREEIKRLDAVPNDDFSKMADAEKWELSSRYNNAVRILKCSVTAAELNA